MGGFELLSSGRSSQISSIHGKMTPQGGYQYQLLPTKSGNLLIDSITVTVAGYTYTIQPIAITVSQGTGNPQPANPQSNPLSQLFQNFPSMPGFPSMPNLPSAPAAQAGDLDPIDPNYVPVGLAGHDFYVEAKVDNTTPYQGEQILYLFRFFQATEIMDSPEYQSPTFTGFWSENQSGQAQYSVVTAGTTYRVSELQTPLFPTVVGEVTIDPARLQIRGGLFSSANLLSTDPIVLNVKPLPDKAPAGFQGAVGRFTIQAEADMAETAVNETVTLNVMVSGQGNIENLADPNWTEGPEWRAFGSQANIQTGYSNGIISGSRTYDRLLVPTTPGNLTLPPIEYIYFDPDTAEYVTVTTDALTVNVAPDGSGLNAPTLPVSNNGSTFIAPGDVPAELRPNKAASPAWNSGSSLLPEKAGYWLLWFVPLFVIGGHFAWQHSQKQRRDNVTLRRSQKAAKKAQQALRQVRKQAADPNSAAGKILNEYIAENFNQSVTGMTQTDLSLLLRAHGAGESLAERVEACLTRCDMGQYAPTDFDNPSGDILKETEQLISDLDRELS